MKVPDTRLRDPEDAWPRWTADLLGRIERGEMEEAANLLACSTNDPSYTVEDTAGHDTMFKHPKVLEHAKVLWKHMLPLITKNCRRAVRREVVKAGWVTR